MIDGYNIHFKIGMNCMKRYILALRQDFVLEFFCGSLKGKNEEKRGFMEVHIKPVQKFQLIKKKVVQLKDIAEIYTLSRLEKQTIENLEVFQVKEDRDKTYLVSILDIIQTIQETYPKASISNLGESDTIIEYHKEMKAENPIWTWIKVGLIAMIVFVGASTTIMCFQTDGQLPEIFLNYYTILTGNIDENLPPTITISYSIGLAVGVLVFFNHFSKFKVTDDPTPIEIEMTTYEKDTNASIIDYLDNQKGKGEE